MIEPAEFHPDATFSVTLAGREWPIPQLVWRDLRKCRAELIELNKRFKAAIIASSAGKDDESEAEREWRLLGELGRVFEALPNDDYDRLVANVLLVGLQAADPNLTREEFCSWRLTEDERQLAWLAVRRQSGLFLLGYAASPATLAEE